MMYRLLRAFILLGLNGLTCTYTTYYIFKPGARRPAAGARLVYRNHFDADVGMCVYVCVCVSAPQAIRN